MILPISFAGLIIKPILVRIAPCRRHSRRRNGRKASYHERVQKKWIRRYGFVDSTPIKRGEVYCFGPYLFVRTDDASLLTAAKLTAFAERSR